MGLRTWAVTEAAPERVAFRDVVAGLIFAAGVLRLLQVFTCILNDFVDRGIQRDCDDPRGAHGPP